MSEAMTMRVVEKRVLFHDKNLLSLPFDVKLPQRASGPLLSGAGLLSDMLRLVFIDPVYLGTN